MDNLKRPASPQPIAFHPESTTPETAWGVHDDFAGFTKLELAALMIAQGILANSPDWSEKEISINWIADNSVKFAKAILQAVNL